MAEGPSGPVVLDTHIVLDVFVFKNPAYQDVEQALIARKLQWMATPHMMQELLWVCERAYMAPWLARAQWTPHMCVNEVGQWAQLQGTAPPCPLRCKDPSDQCFIDLTVQHQAVLISKDKAVLRLAKRLARIGVAAGPTWRAALARINSPTVTPGNPPPATFLG